ncbi:TonB C-terminal domain-containing protein [Sphingomonadaceae bacterium]|nr:TonB C-terminal domain-containing protein [Sphingomonadaceae bacterium]
MSILAAIFLAAQGSAPAADAENTITIMARRLDAVQVSVNQDDDGRWSCSLDKSSGVATVDDGLCRAVTKCVRKGATGGEAVRACVKRSKSALLAKFKRELERRR